MAISIHGTNGISGVNGSSSAPALQGTDSDTGIVFGSDTASISTAGTQRLGVDTSGVDVNGNLSISTSGTQRLGVDANGVDVNGNYVSNIVAMSGVDIDCSAGNYFTKTINGNTTFTISNVPASRAFSLTLELTHTSGTVTWPASVKFPAATAPTLTAGKTHLFVLVTDDGGTKFRANAVVDFDN